MKIDGAIPRGRPTAVGAAEERPTLPPPLVHAPPDDQPDSRSALPRRPFLLRGALSALRYSTLQNLPATRANYEVPGSKSTDSQLAKALETAFGILHPYLKDGQLTHSSLRQVAALELGENDVLNRAILAAREVLNRPRLSDAIMNSEGYITRDSLRRAATQMTGSSAPSACSQDPFHSQSNAQVVKALQGEFEQLRDASKDRTVFFEKYQYMPIATLRAVTADPDAVDPQGLPVLDAATGLPKKQYSEHCVYTAKNVIERPGLLHSLERGTVNGLFGRAYEEGWLSNKSLERWLKQDHAHKAR
ncbi:type III secretion protein [Pseudomonas sp. S1_E04]